MARAAAMEAAMLPEAMQRTAETVCASSLVADGGVAVEASGGPGGAQWCEGGSGRAAVEAREYLGGGQVSTSALSAAGSGRAAVKAREYLCGMAWLLQMYAEGVCGDLGYTYPFEHAPPSASLALHLEAIAAGSLPAACAPLSELPALTAPLAYCMLVPPAAMAQAPMARVAGEEDEAWQAAVIGLAQREWAGQGEGAEAGWREEPQAVEPSAREGGEASQGRAGRVADLEWAGQGGEGAEAGEPAAGAGGEASQGRAGSVADREVGVGASGGDGHALFDPAPEDAIDDPLTEDAASDLIFEDPLSEDTNEEPLSEDLLFEDADGDPCEDPLLEDANEDALNEDAEVDPAADESHDPVFRNRTYASILASADALPSEMLARARQLAATPAWLVIQRTPPRRVADTPSGRNPSASHPNTARGQAAAVSGAPTDAATPLRATDTPPGRGSVASQPNTGRGPPEAASGAPANPALAGLPRTPRVPPPPPTARMRLLHPAAPLTCSWEVAEVRPPTNSPWCFAAHKWEDTEPVQSQEV